MGQRHWTILLLIVLLLPLKGENANLEWQNLVPQIVASVNGKKINKTEAIEILAKSVDLKKVNSKNFLVLLKSSLEEEWCRRILRKKLINENFPPSYQQSLSFLLAEAKLNPMPLSAVTRLNIERMAKDEEVQLRIAMQLALSSRHSPQFAVTSQEIEEYYRNNQTLFLRPEIIKVDVIEVPNSTAGHRELERVVDYVKQGGLFKSAKESCKLAKKQPTITQQEVTKLTQNLATGTVSEILSIRDSLVLIFLEKRIAQSYYPLNAVSQLIHQKLMGELVAKELKLILERTLSEMKIEYYKAN